ncbi:unnamed protein product [Microthlaspi erraticum]|uniref:RRM domain-containing protein n=1 Tax=Microthlaspi erraticum TaxID=1685480 RepID=A0A6D2JHM7_9BRAS|nr:unnamed protein product [Microthlaspi erraticum]
MEKNQSRVITDQPRGANITTRIRVQEKPIVYLNVPDQQEAVVPEPIAPIVQPQQWAIVHVPIHQEPPPEAEPAFSSTVFVSNLNLDEETARETVESLFNGNLEIRLIRNAAGEFRGWCHVVFATPEAA